MDTHPTQDSDLPENSLPVHVLSAFVESRAILV